MSRPSLIVYRPGLTVRDYIELAGGPTSTGVANRAVIDYPSGFSRRVKRTALVFTVSPPVVSGAIITVPARPEPTTSASDVWQRALASATALASLALAYAAITR